MHLSKSVFTVNHVMHNNYIAPRRGHHGYKTILRMYGVVVWKLKSRDRKVSLVCDRRSCRGLWLPTGLAMSVSTVSVYVSKLGLEFVPRLLWSAIVDKNHDYKIASMFPYMISTSRSLMSMYRSSMSTFRSWIAMFRSPLLTWMLAAVYYIDIRSVCFHLRRSGDRMRALLVTCTEAQ